MELKRTDWVHIGLSLAVVAVLAVLVYQWVQCEGTFVRTLFWFTCLP